MPQKETLDKAAYTCLLVFYRRLSPLFQFSLSAVTLVSISMVHNHTVSNARPPVEHSHANGVATQTRSPKISSLHAVITMLFYACLSIHYVSASLPRIKSALPYRVKVQGFLMSKFLITKFLITKFLITKFLSNKVPKLQNS
jgi:hypothetical protein